MASTKLVSCAFLVSFLSLGSAHRVLMECMDDDHLPKQAHMAQAAGGAGEGASGGGIGAGGGYGGGIDSSDGGMPSFGPSGGNSPCHPVHGPCLAQDATSNCGGDPCGCTSSVHQSKCAAGYTPKNELAHGIKDDRMNGNKKMEDHRMLDVRPSNRAQTEPIISGASKTDRAGQGSSEPWRCGSAHGMQDDNMNGNNKTEDPKMVDVGNGNMTQTKPIASGSTKTDKAA